MVCVWVTQNVEGHICNAGGIYVFCPVRPSVCLSIRPLCFSWRDITNEPLDGSSWKCRTVWSTSKWRPELFFWGCDIQDSQLSTTFIWNLYWSLSFYWIKYWPQFFFAEVTIKKISYRQLPKMNKNWQKSCFKLCRSITFYWIKTLAWNFVFYI